MNNESIYSLTCTILLTVVFPTAILAMNWSKLVNSKKSKEEAFDEFVRQPVRKLCGTSISFFNAKRTYVCTIILKVHFFLDKDLILECACLRRILTH